MFPFFKIQKKPKLIIMQILQPLRFECCLLLYVAQTGNFSEDNCVGYCQFHGPKVHFIVPWMYQGIIQESLMVVRC